MNAQVDHEGAAATPADSLNYADKLAPLRQAGNSGKTRTYRWRVEQLKAVKAMLQDNETAFFDALAKDLGKPKMEAYGTEVSYVANEVDHCLRNLRRWMKPRRVPTPVVAQPGSSHIMAEPLGVVLVMSAWNYPVQVALAPLVAAVSAGNCVVIKPSELAPATSSLLARLIPEYLDPECFVVVEGAVEETTALLSERFDHIIYTGGGAVGRIVMAAAARHLTPVTLELGGKSPCIILPDAKLDVAARRIVWGRFMNAGQTCVSPDHILTDAETAARLVPLLKKAIHDMFGDDPQKSDSYGRIVNGRHFQRLLGLISPDKVAIGGQHDESDRYLAPTVLSDVSVQDPSMQEEIFGPILPIMHCDNLDAAIEQVKAGDKPLAAYLFTRDRSAQKIFLNSISAGMVCLNDVLMFSAVPELPFGGVGESGTGAYKGENGFMNFSHRKAVLKRPFWGDVALRYAPYTEQKFRWIKRLLG